MSPKRRCDAVKPYIAIHYSHGPAFYALLDGQMVETVDVDADGTPVWDSGAFVDIGRDPEVDGMARASVALLREVAGWEAGK